MIIRQNYLGRIYFTSNDGSQNTFVYQPTLDTLEFKKDKSTDNVLIGKGVFHFKLKPLYTVFVHSIKRSGYRNGIKFDRDPVELQNKTIT